MHPNRDYSGTRPKGTPPRLGRASPRGLIGGHLCQSPTWTTILKVLAGGFSFSNGR